MRGLELSRAFFEEHGRPMLEAQFPELLPYLAVGLFGSGSECFGWDDEVSRDHDFEPGFMIFLPGEEVVDRRSAFLLERAYAGLPKSYGGVRRSVLLPVGGARHGVFRTGDYFLSHVGAAEGMPDTTLWLTLPEEALAEAVNGEVFFDNFGEVTRIREGLARFPEDVRLKRLAGQLLLMAQSGQYNYARCLAHGEPEAAQLAAAEFVKSALSAVFLLAKRYQPYYKWAFRALRELPVLSSLASPLATLLTGPAGEAKTALIEDICRSVAGELTAQGLNSGETAELEPLAYAVNDRIRDGEVRNLHILATV